jgi:flagellar hook-associated protein 1 FlgK
VSSLSSILNVARGAMQAAQIQMQTTGQNIANASVDGYTVQKVRIMANTPEHFPYGSLGTGIVVAGVGQARDALLDAQFRASNGRASYASTSSDVMTRVEQVLGEPSTTGLSNSLDQFWNSWSDLASDPTSLTARGVVAARGSQLAGMLNGFATSLDTVSADARASINGDMTKVNQIATQLAQMNPEIVAAEANGSTANDLRDTRNRLLDQLSGLVDAQVTTRSDGSVGVYMGGRMLVDGTSAHQLATNGGIPVAITFAGETNALTNIGGSIGASLTTLNQTVGGVMADLDTLASTLVQQVNAIHSTGTVFVGGSTTPSSAGNFFNQSATVVGPTDPFQTARGISISASLSDVTQVAASAPGSTGGGNNGVASLLAGLRDKSLTFTAANGNTVNDSLGGFYRYTVSGVALATNLSSSQASVEGALATQADTRRQSVSGVATDEELVNLIKQQQAYSAAARLVSVVDEMSKTLVALGQ